MDNKRFTLLIIFSNSIPVIKINLIFKYSDHSSNPNADTHEKNY